MVFATAAMGMGVNAKQVRQVIHITPSTTLESYFQVIRRAGRDGVESQAVLYYNNSDIHINTHVTDEVRNYCRADGCLRTSFLAYFGYGAVVQERCCSNCHPKLVQLLKTSDDVLNYRLPVQPDAIPLFSEEVSQILCQFNQSKTWG